MKIAWLLVGSLALCSAPAVAAISVDSPGVMGLANSPTNAFTFTVGSGADRVLVVGAASTGNTGYFPVSSVSFKGVALSLEIRTQYSNAVHQDVELWYLVAPAAGSSGTLTVTYPGLVESVVGAMEFAGVDPYTTFGALTSSAASADTLTTALTTSFAGSWALLNCANYKNQADLFVQDPTFTGGGWGGQSGGTIGLFQSRGTGAPGLYSGTTSYTDSTVDTVIQQMAELVPLQATSTVTPTFTITPIFTVSQTFTVSPTVTVTPTATFSPTVGPDPQSTPASGKRGGVSPNPFFPDRPPLDRAVFALEPGHAGVRLSILDLNFRVLREDAFAPAAVVFWDGRDQRGRPQRSGAYLYLLEEDGQRPVRGYLVLAR